MEAEVVSAPRLRGVSLAAAYSAFAAVATCVNLAVQAGTLALISVPGALLLAMALGTVAGIVPKYLLDKRWIFADRSVGARNHARRFAIYTLLSVATTLVFWVTEIAFDRIGGGDWHYVGAVLGLAVGYWLKYQLDLRYTFTPAAE
jgi:putative flippase GtrA